MMNIKVTGLDELQKKLNKLSDEIANAIEDGILDAANIVKKAAIENAKKGGNNFPHKVTGNLENDLETSNPMSIEKTATKITKGVGTTVAYGPRLEWGFTGTDSLGRRYTQRPRAFLRPALDDNEKEIIAAISKTILVVVSKYK